MRNTFIVTLALLLILTSSARAKVIRITSQEQFDMLDNTIHQMMQDGYKEIVVDIAPGVFFFKEKHININSVSKTNVTILFRGHHSTIVPKGIKVETNNRIKGYGYNSSIVIPEREEIVNPWQETKYALEDVEVLDVEKKQCRIKTNEYLSLSADECKGSFIMLTAWCRSYYYGICKIDNNYIYFMAYNIENGIDWIKSRKGYNVNNDYLYSGSKPRYRLCNTKPMNIGEVHLCDAQTFLFVEGCGIKTLKIEGLFFLGNKTKGSADELTTSLIVFKNVKSKKITINNCRFVGQNSRVVGVINTDNVIIDRNYFAHNFRYGVVSDNMSEGTSITKNEFEFNGEDYSSNRCVKCSGPDYYVANNSFKNFGYCAISLGLWYGSNADKRTNGIVENNNIYYTDDWMKDVWKHSIMDGGAIYLFTKNDGAIIRYNRINNYSGAKDNRGIFCDDGAYGFQIYGNVITGIDNSYCIDSRRVASVEKDKYPKSGIERSNINNVIRDNVLDGTIKFEGNDGYPNGCIKGCNYFLVDDVYNIPDNILKNVSQEFDDIVLEVNGKKENKVCLESLSYRKIKKNKEWRSIKKHISK